MALLKALKNVAARAKAELEQIDWAEALADADLSGGADTDAYSPPVGESPDMGEMSSEWVAYYCEPRTNLHSFDK